MVSRPDRFEEERTGNIASAFTGSFTFWAWTVLDINRLLMTKLFYLGQAPVEYAWSAKSKQVRKRWERAQKATYI